MSFVKKSVRFLVIASDLNMSLIKKLYFLKKNLKLLKDFLTKYVDAPGTCLIIILYRCRLSIVDFEEKIIFGVFRVNSTKPLHPTSQNSFIFGI